MTMKNAPMSPETFRRIRKRAGLQQWQLGEVLGYSPQHVSKIETGHFQIERRTALAMAWIEVFGPRDPFADDWHPRFANENPPRWLKRDGFSWTGAKTDVRSVAGPRPDPSE